MRYGTVLVGAAALIATTGAALADHGKVGLWQVTTKMAMPGMASGAQTFNAQHCMTAAEVKQNSMPAPTDAACKMVNEKMSGASFSGDLVCSNREKGSGHISVTYDSDTHYAGQMTMTSMVGSQAVRMTDTFEGKWLSADCGKVHR